MSDPWYPQGEGYLTPAFQVQRRLVSDVVGGDYVRGSTVETLPQTALRYRSVEPGAVEGIQNRALVHARPFAERVQVDGEWVLQCDTAEILWGWAKTGGVSSQLSYKWDDDQTSAAPASGYTKIHLGTVYVHETDADGTAHPELANLKKGDNIYAYPARAPIEGNFTQEAYFEVTDVAIQHTTPTTYYEIPISVVSTSGLQPLADDSPVLVVLPIAGSWLEVALVRSGFGYPVTVNDGQTVFKSSRVQFEGTSALVPPPVVYDTPLTPGHWYYYSLFYRISAQDWVRGGSDAVLLPRYWRHNEHLWNSVPPYYQWTDSNLREGSGPLRQWLDIFGFELDTTREFVESWQNLYHIDLSPSSLLRQLGANFGTPYEAALGDIRYRSLLAALPDLLQQRGTIIALEKVIEASTKYDCDVRQGSNMVVLADDAEFFGGTGNWAAFNPATTGMGGEITSVDPNTVDNVILVQSGMPPKDPINPANDVPGRRSLRTYTSKAVESQNLFLTLGDGIFNQTVEPVPPPTGAVPSPGSSSTRTILPRYGGVAVLPQRIYGFQVYVRVEAGAPVFRLYLMWFKQGGDVLDLLAFHKSNADLTGTTSWTRHSVQAIAPDQAVYLVPGIYFKNRSGGPTGRSYWVEMAGVQVARLGAEVVVDMTPPDLFLTMGSSTELLGTDPTRQGGWILGRPKTDVNEPGADD